MLRAYKNQKHSKNLLIDHLFNLSTSTNSFNKKVLFKATLLMNIYWSKNALWILLVISLNIFNKESQSAEKILKQIRR